MKLTARITDRAEPGQVLVSNVVRELCAGRTFEFTSVGDATLKGVRRAGGAVCGGGMTNDTTTKLAYGSSEVDCVALHIGDANLVPVRVGQVEAAP